MIPVEHLNSNISTHQGLTAYLNYWEKVTDIPRMLDWSPEEAKDHFRSLLRSFSTDLSQSLNLNIVWKDDDAEPALAAILARLKMSPATPEA